MSARTVTYVIHYDYVDLSKMPDELKEYLRPVPRNDGSGVHCSTVMEGNALSEAGRLKKRINRLIEDNNLDEELEEIF